MCGTLTCGDVDFLSDDTDGVGKSESDIVGGRYFVDEVSKSTFGSGVEVVKEITCITCSHLSEVEDWHGLVVGNDGCGVGQTCFGKDLRYYLSTADRRLLDNERVDWESVEGFDFGKDGDGIGRRDISHRIGGVVARWEQKAKGKKETVDKGLPYRTEMRLNTNMVTHHKVFKQIPIPRVIGKDSEINRVGYKEFKNCWKELLETDDMSVRGR